MVSDPDGRAWQQMLAHLKRHHPAIGRQWFEELDFLGVGGGVLRVRAHSPVHRDYLQRQCVESFNEAAQAVTGRLLTVRFLGPEDGAEPEREAAAVARGARDGRAPTNGAGQPVARSAGRSGGGGGGGGGGGSPSRADALVLNPDHSFDNFVIGPGNRLAHAAALAVAEAPGQRYNPLFIHGDVGLGKSHLLQAICLRILEQDPGTVLYYTSCDAFKNQYFEAVQAGQMGEFRHTFRDVDVLVIDDIHFLARWEKSQEEFFHTYNSLHQDQRQLILSSDAAPEEIPHLEGRLVSRFKQGMVANIQPPDFETRVAIVKKKAALRGMEMPEDVAFHIASCIDTNIRELEGAITGVQMQAHIEGKKVPDLATARAAVGESALRLPGRPTIQTVISVVTDFYGTRLTDLQSKKKPQSIVLPRQVCMYLARAHTRHSLQEIGGHLGGRDHTTVMHAVKAVDEKRRADAEFDAQVGALDERLKKMAT
ncbi:MAG: chromosomal replication initiator protein DnaA [Phycisphaerales bacterium]